MKVVNVLGTEYTITEDVSKDSPKMKERSGYIEAYSKEIMIREIEVDEDTYNKIEEFKKKVIRHELMHAFFHESGIDEWYEDEELVNFFALQLPKIFKVMQDSECL